MTVVIAAGGCARFDESVDSPFRPAPTLQPQEILPPPPAAPDSSSPDEPAQPPTADSSCPDPDPAVIAGCLDIPTSIVMLPGSESALVAERRTGRIVEVFRDGRDPEPVITIPVDGGSDGGLLDLALSPTYAEDGLIYAYISTSSDNRVVRIARGDTPKPVLVGLPRGSRDNAGKIAFVGRNELMILTGDAGSPTAALNPNSQAGKLLLLSDLSISEQPKPTRVVMPGIGRAGGLCPGVDGTMWVTDSFGGIDRLHRISSDGVVGVPVWTWPDAPGVAGCAAGESDVVVALDAGRAIAILSIDPQTGVVGTAPGLIAQNQYGRFSGVAAASPSEVWVTTVNRDEPNPTPAATDDRVVIIVPAPAGAGRD